jgi:3-dehydroquinate synthase
MMSLSVRKVKETVRQKALHTEECLYRMPWEKEGSYDVYLSEGLLDSDNDLFAGVVGSRRAIAVLTPTVARLYGPALERYAASHRLKIEQVVIDVSEGHKAMPVVELVARRALDAKLERTDLMVAVGGGICSDIVSMAASMVRRGIGVVRIPTTLIGQIDAGIGVKGAVNFCSKKSYLGCFYPPESVCIDPLFLQTLPQSHLRNGLAEIIKMAIVRDEELFHLIATHFLDLIGSGFQHPHEESRRIIGLATIRMLEELEPNLFENRSYQRLVDFGHTFSPAVEAATDFRIPHGAAVAIDMALSATLATHVGLMSKADSRAIVTLLLDVGLPVWTNILTPELCRGALEEAARHRGSRVNLVLPVKIGAATFMDRCESLTPAVLQSAIQHLLTASTLSSAPPAESTPRAFGQAEAFYGYLADGL